MILKWSFKTIDISVFKFCFFLGKKKDQENYTLVNTGMRRPYCLLPTFLLSNP